MPKISPIALALLASSSVAFAQFGTIDLAVNAQGTDSAEVALP